MLRTKCLCRTKAGTMFFLQVHAFESVQSLFHCFTVIFVEKLACSKQFKIFLLCDINCGSSKHCGSESLCFKKCNNSNSDKSNNNNDNNVDNNDNNINNIINNNNINKNKDNFHKQGMMSTSQIKFDEGFVTMNKFSNANGSNSSLSQICLMWQRDPCSDMLQYLSSLLDYLLDNNCKYLYRFKLWIRVHRKC